MVGWSVKQDDDHVLIGGGRELAAGVPALVCGAGPAGLEAVSGSLLGRSRDVDGRLAGGPSLRRTAALDRCGLLRRLRNTRAPHGGGAYTSDYETSRFV